MVGTARKPPPTAEPPMIALASSRLSRRGEIATSPCEIATEPFETAAEARRGRTRGHGVAYPVTAAPSVAGVIAECAIMPAAATLAVIETMLTEVGFPRSKLRLTSTYLNTDRSRLFRDRKYFSLCFLILKMTRGVGNFHTSSKSRDRVPRCEKGTSKCTPLQCSVPCCALRCLTS